MVKIRANGVFGSTETKLIKSQVKNENTVKNNLRNMFAGTFLDFTNTIPNPHSFYACGLAAVRCVPA